MRIGTLKSMAAAAALAALMTPAMAQNSGRTNEGGAGANSNAARGAVGEAGTVQRNSGAGATTGTPGVVREGNAQAGQIVREGAEAADQITNPGRPALGAQGGAVIEGQPSRTANFPPGQPGDDARMNQNQGQLGNAALARWLIADNEAEIRVSEVANQKSQNQDVKQFAQQMIKDHGQMVQQLEQVAGGQGHGNRGAGSDSPAAGRRTANFPPNADADRNDARDDAADRNDADRNDADRGTRRGANRGDRNADAATLEGTEGDRPAGAAGRPGMGRQGGNNAGVAFHRQIKQQLTQRMVQNLQSKNGAEFDKAYINGQVLAHEAELATLQVAQQHATGDLKQQLQTAQQEVQQHLDHAKQLAQQLEGQNNR